MKLFLIIVLLLFSSCSSGQQPEEKDAEVDSMQLLEPKPEQRDALDTQMFTNCILLFNLNYTVVNNGKKQSYQDLDSVAHFLKKNATAIARSKFYVLLMDSNAKYSEIVSVLDIVRKVKKIENFKLIDFQPPKPVQIEAPHTTISSYQENDSLAFEITILKGYLEVKLSGNKTKLKTQGELDDFMTKHKSDIDRNKISIIAASDIAYDKFNPVVEVLKKHHYYRYNLVTK